MNGLLRTVRRARRLATAAAFAALATASASTPASAGPVERVEDELRRTEHALESAESVVREGRSERARDILDVGRGVQTKAWENFRENRLAVARQMTFEARKLAVKAAALARGDAGLKARAQREIEVAETMLRDALDEMSSTRSEPALRLLDQARAQIERGRTQLGQQNYEAALRLALSAQRLIRQALDLGDVIGAPMRLDRELERTDGVLERAGEPVRESGDEVAIRLLARAVELQAKARDAKASGSWRLALAGTREARTLALRALARAHGPLDAGRVREELERTDHDLARAAEVVDASDSVSAMRLLVTARSHQDRARSLAGEQDFRSALAQTLVARRLALRSIQMAQGDRP